MSVILSKSMQDAKYRGIKRYAKSRSEKIAEMVKNRTLPKRKKTRVAIPKPLKGADNSTKRLKSGNKAILKKLSRTRSWYVKELDRVFSIFIRQRDATPQGLVKCFTCPKTDHWKSFDNSHYYSRRFMSLRWNEKNCHAACKKCNVFMEGNKPAYTLALIKRYGNNILQELEIKKNNISKLGIFELKYLIEEYKSKINSA